MKEVWKAVAGYEGLYEVSSEGRIRGIPRFIRHPRGGCRLWAGKILVEWPMYTGYVAVTLCSDGRRKVRTVHSIVAEAFHGPRPLGWDVAHYDGNRKNNTASNLSWKTRAANHADKIRHGTTNRGERQGQAKLTNGVVKKVRKLHSDGMSGCGIAKKFGVSPTTINNVLRRVTWAHVE